MWSKALQNQIPESLVKNCRFLGTGLPYPPESHEEAQESAFITGVCMRWGGEGVSRGAAFYAAAQVVCALCVGGCVCARGYARGGGAWGRPSQRQL